MKVKIVFTNGVLGTCSANVKVHEEFIALKSKDSEKLKEELANLPAEEAMERIETVFPRNKNGTPILYDYQVRGFLKARIGACCDFDDIAVKHEGKRAIKISKWTYKRFVDEFIFVKPREIKLVIPSGRKITKCTRPLRATTMRGDRVALATSEELPAGTMAEFDVVWDYPGLEEVVRTALDHGEHIGLLQWRNSGKGTFAWTEVKGKFGEGKVS